MVEIAPGVETPPGYCAVLMMTCSNPFGTMGRAFPKLVREDLNAEVLLSQHPYSQYCMPHGVRVCSLSVGRHNPIGSSEVHVRPGALSKLMLGDSTPSFSSVRYWHPDAEDLVLAARFDQRSGRESFQLVIHTADMAPREYSVDMSAFTSPHSLRQILPV